MTDKDNDTEFERNAESTKNQRKLDEKWAKSVLKDIGQAIMKKAEFYDYYVMKDELYAPSPYIRRLYEKRKR